MHVEPPKEPLMTVREFGLHYLMIVVSILTAIGLEEALRAYHNHEAAAAAESAIETELRDNLSALRQAIKRNEERREELHKIGDELADDIRKSGAGDALKKKLVEDYAPKLTVGLLLPGMSHDAWDVAVASQAATFIPHDKLSAYADLYTTEREALAGANSGLMMLDAPRLIDFKADIEVGIADPKRLLELLRESGAMNAVGLGNLVAAEKDMTATFKKTGLSDPG